jgi:hypothetical protein
MPNMKSVDRSAFSEASHGTFDFEEQEIVRIGELAEELKNILIEAKRRDQKRIEQYK